MGSKTQTAEKGQKNVTILFLIWQAIRIHALTSRLFCKEAVCFVVKDGDMGRLHTYLTFFFLQKSSQCSTIGLPSELSKCMSAIKKWECMSTFDTGQPTWLSACKAPIATLHATASNNMQSNANIRKGFNELLDITKQIWNCSYRYQHITNICL